MTRTLGALVDATPGARLVAGRPDQVVSALTHDSRRVTPGALFVSLPGRRSPADTFVPMALERGAVAIVSETPTPHSTAPAWIVVPSARQALADLAAAWHGYPSERLRVIGVTGTDGKTTTTRLIAGLLQAADRRAGWYTTADLHLGDGIVPNADYHTTPEADRVQEVLGTMVAAGLDYAVLEASSHALAQDRLRRCAVDVAVFTNLSPEHLDFHGSLEAYLAAKARLFALAGQPARPDAPDTAVANPLKRAPYVVLNADDPACEALRAAARVPVRTYSLGGRADVVGHDLVEMPEGLRLRVATADGEWELATRFLGRFNAANWLAAITVALAEGVPVSTIQQAARALQPPPGRLERVDCGQPFAVYVDFAHTPQALAAALRAIRAVARGRVLLAFGQASGRTAENRPAMGRAAAELADYFVITSDDAAPDEARAISADIARGAQAAGAGTDRFRIELDRRAALRHLFARARPGDAVLLAGKGHERTLKLGDRIEPWSEAEVARALLHELGYPG
ncbi:MAG: UDP-N-acetylmuramoyl-L-alanyl-D-glutamate--2,6-diaminopimelate ligase [Chloroflexi bacterium]|nr:UDP-N-acetylmuramoyl-L-alanyl-D-glutamate--2,6-diaminopimelate ligase [Chloroflexota bacterium]